MAPRAGPRGLAVLVLAVGCKRIEPSEPPSMVVVPQVAAAASEPPDASGSEPEPARSDAVPAGAALVAVVNGQPVSRAAFDEIYRLKVAKYGDRGRAIPPSASRRYRKSIVERLVYHEQLRQAVVELGVDIDPAKLQARIDASRRGIHDWDKHLERRGETEASLQAMYVAELREELVLERSGGLALTRAEIEADYEKVKENWEGNEPRIRASHILVEVAAAGPDDDPAALEAAARAEAERLSALARAPGADFAALARESSTGPSATGGGDLGIFTRARMAEEFSRAAFSMKVGEVSKPVRTRFGFHIILVTGKWPRGTLPLEALEDQISERLVQRKLHEGRRTLKEELQTTHPVTHLLLTPEDLEPPRDRDSVPQQLDETQPVL